MSCVHIKSLSAKVEEIEIKFQVGEKADLSCLPNINREYLAQF